MKKSITLLFVALILFYQCSIHENHGKITDKAGFCLTFDDRDIDEWNEILPILDSNNIHVTFFVRRMFKCTPNEINILIKFKDHGNEIACHGWNHINSVEFLKSHSINEYFKEEIEPAINKMDSSGLHPITFSYPFGFHCDSLDSALLNNFKLLRACCDEQRTKWVKNIDNIDDIYFDFNHQKVISALGIDTNFRITLNEIEKGFKRASENHEVIVFYAHEPVTKSTGDYQIEIDFLRKIISLAKKYNLRSYTFSELAEN